MLPLQSELLVHYENNSPFLTVTKLTRTVEVSHWGNIAVEEILDIVHSGAKLKGSFSRYDYQRNQDGVSSIKSFKVTLPNQCLAHCFYNLLWVVMDVDGASDSREALVII